MTWILLGANCLIPPRALSFLPLPLSLRLSIPCPRGCSAESCAGGSQLFDCDAWPRAGQDRDDYWSAELSATPLADPNHISDTLQDIVVDDPSLKDLGYRVCRKATVRRNAGIFRFAPIFSSMLYLHTVHFARSNGALFIFLIYCRLQIL